MSAHSSSVYACEGAPVSSSNVYEECMTLGEDGALSFVRDVESTGDQRIEQLVVANQLDWA